eukprot:c4114_g1_i2.p1 GENE.c4114_g1_i2~~c4114_g1_i2.p1  ORF type:complete len:283 (+),score=34.24 c4114_g1_i2:153-1001(+)
MCAVLRAGLPCCNHEVLREYVLLKLSRHLDYWRWWLPAPLRGRTTNEASQYTTGGTVLLHTPSGSHDLCNQALNRMLGAVRVRCPSACGWKGAFSDVDYHLDHDCVYTMVTCDLCSGRMPRAALVSHACFPSTSPSAPVITGISSSQDELTEQMAAKDDRIRYLSVTLEESESAKALLEKRLALTETELVSTKRLVQDLLRELEVVNNRLKTEIVPWRCDVCDTQFERYIPDHVCIPKDCFHPGTYAKRVWKQQQSWSWTCCGAMAQNARGCKLRPSGDVNL